jgi:hypothetical protein
MMVNWIIFIVIAILLVTGIEYFSRSFPPPWRMLSLGLIVLILVIWLLGLMGYVPLPMPR